MRRRVAFLSAIAPIPQVLLLDEPFSSIDQPTQIAIHEDVRRISAELGITLILVTHDLAEAISLGSEVIVMTHRPGRIRTRVVVEQSLDTPLLELRERPEFLRKFRELWHYLAAEIAQTQQTEPDM